MGNASRDANRVPTLLGVSSADFTTPVTVGVDPTTHGLLLDAASLSANLSYKLFITIGYSNADYICTGASSGTTDDAQIQAAITSLTNGGTVYIKDAPTNYNITATIHIPAVDNLIIMGQGFSTILKAKSSLNADMFDINVDANGTQRQLEIAHLCLDGNIANQSSGSGIDFINPNGTYQILKSFVHHLYIKNVKDNGIYFNTSNTPESNYQNQFSDLWFDGCGVGIKANEVVFATFSDIHIRNGVSYGLLLQGISGQTMFTNIEIDSRGANTMLGGINATHTNACFVNCQVNYCIRNYEFHTTEAYSLNLTNCISYGAKQMGFYLVTAHGTHTISCTNCFSTSEGQDTGYSAGTRVGFYLYGAGTFILTGCQTHNADAATTQYSVSVEAATDAYGTTNIQVSNCEFILPAVAVWNNINSNAYTLHTNNNTTNPTDVIINGRGTYFDHYTNAGNVTTGETDLYSDTLPANALRTNGDKIEAEYGGVFVSSGTASREVKVYFGGTAIFDTGALTLSLSSAWTCYVTLIRVSSTVIRYMISFTTEGAALAAYTAVGELTGLTLSNTNILKVTGQAAGVGAATNDIVAKLGTVSFFPAA